MLTSRQIYDRLIDGYGQPDWWPGSPYAIMVTAVLVQNTAWSNVEKTMAEMGERLEPEYIDGLTEDDLQPLIRSCGFYRDKGRYVKSLTGWFKGYGYAVETVQKKPLHDVRQELLALPGIGAETADAILTYAFRMPSFVLDAYTRRFLERRRKNNAEVFTPAWICNRQNNMVDAVWFGRSNVFNTEKGTVVTEFDEGLWGTLVDFMTVYGKEDISVTFKDGTEIHIG